MLLCTTLVRAQEKLVVHEWGTFTTLEGSDGLFLPGLYHEEERLPSFVEHSGEEYNNGLNKGYYECRNVSVKMETPVIYFYSNSDTSRLVKVRVDWPAGSISQWYPNRDSGDYTNMHYTVGVGWDTADFSQRHDGWIEWTVRVRERSVNDTDGMAKTGETHTWQAPRATDANVIEWPGIILPNWKVKPQVEKYLFYRGIGNASQMEGPNFEPPIHLQMRGDTLAILNYTFYNIPFGFVYEMTDSGERNIWWSGAINGAESFWNVTRPAASLSFDDALNVFRDSLVASGLYRKEADAMIETWRQSYFNKPGLRLFYIYPRLSVERTLPLAISPKPDSIERVLVARAEILSPSFENKLIEQFEREKKTGYNDFAGDRYYLAYEARAQQLLQGASVAPVEDRSFQSFPNPATDRVTIVNVSADKTIATNELGREFSVAMQHDGKDTHCDLSSLPAGVYLLRVESNGRTLRQLIVKR